MVTIPMVTIPRVTIPRVDFIVFPLPINLQFLDD